jgi:ligand-binding sensor protein
LDLDLQVNDGRRLNRNDIEDEKGSSDEDLDKNDEELIDNDENYSINNEEDYEKKRIYVQ